MIITKEALDKHNLSLEEFLTLLLIKQCDSTNFPIKNLHDKFLISTTRSQGDHIVYYIAPKGIELLEAILIDSGRETPSLDLVALAKQMQDIFPNGKKSGTNYYWRDNVPTIVKKLKVFFKRYGNNYTIEQLLLATKRYVKSFNGNYNYMQLLKYFIWKDKIDGSQDSELLTYLDNLDEEEEEIMTNNDWTSILK